jgi:hypothetical protein
LVLRYSIGKRKVSNTSIAIVMCDENRELTKKQRSGKN